MGNTFTYNDVMPTGNSCYFYKDVTPTSLQYQSKISTIAKNLHNFLNSGDVNGFKSYVKYFDLTHRKTILSYKINGVNCVHIACVKNDVHSMKFMLEECEIDPNTKINSFEETPLNVSCRYGKLGVAQCLIHHGAKVHQLTRDGQSCLQLCKENEGMCRLLISNGVDVNSWKNSEDVSIVFEACEKGNVDLVNFLIKYNARMDVKNKHGLTPIEAAAHFYLSKKCGSRHNEVIDTLVEVPNISDSNKINALEIAGCERIKRYLHPIWHCPRKSKCLEVAKSYWHQALTLRLKGQQQGLMEDYEQNKSEVLQDVQKYQSEDDLNQIYTDRKRIIMEAVLLMECHFGISDNQTILFLKHLAKRYVEERLPEAGIGIFKYSLKYIVNNVTSVGEAWIDEFQFILLYWVRFHELINDDESSQTFQTILWFLENLKYSKGPETSKSLSTHNVATIFAILKYVAGWKCIIKRESCLGAIISKLNRSCFTYEPQSLLHYCVHAYFCWSGRDECRRLKCIQLIRYLLLNGMSPDITDELGDTPLITCIRGWDCSCPMVEEIINVLIEFSHLDMLTREGQSALLLLKAKGFAFSEVNFRTLQCLAANVIVNENIPYRGIVPKSIAAFIETH